MAERSRDKEQFWRRTLAQFDPQRDTVRAFCRRLGLSEPSFYSWRSELRRRAQDVPLFQPVHIAAVPAPTPPAVIHVRLRGGRSLRVQAGFDAELLRQVVTVLEAVPQPHVAPC